MTQLQKLGTRGTGVYNQDGLLSVRYHSTEIVRVDPNGRITLNHGGWMTATTKTRMNQASRQYDLGFSVWQKDFVWYIDIDSHTLDFDQAVKVIREEEVSK